MVGARNELITPIISVHEGIAAFYTGTASTEGGLVIKPNQRRANGVFVQNTDSGASSTLAVGPTAAACQFLLARWAATLGSPNGMFFPGAGGLYIVGTITTTTYAAWEY